MITLIQLQNFLDSYMHFDSSLNVSKIDPYMTNGLMVKGNDQVKTVGFGVSASLNLFQKAKEENCDAIIVHHSFNYPPYNRFDSIFQGRMNFLLNNSISLFGYHFLLDAHPEIGNNAEIIRTFGARPTEPYLHRGDPWGWSGVFNKKISLKSLIENLSPFMSKSAVIYDSGPENVKNIVAVSGKGAAYPSDMQYLKDCKIDLFITGEVHEWNRELFREAGINFIAAGHYHTEKFGIKALMNRVSSEFKNLKTVFLDLPNYV